MGRVLLVPAPVILAIGAGVGVGACKTHLKVHAKPSDPEATTDTGAKKAPKDLSRSHLSKHWMS